MALHHALPSTRLSTLTATAEASTAQETVAAANALSPTGIFHVTLYGESYAIAANPMRDWIAGEGMVFVSMDVVPEEVVVISTAIQARVSGEVMAIYSEGDLCLRC